MEDWSLERLLPLYTSLSAFAAAPCLFRMSHILNLLRPLEKLEIIELDGDLSPSNRAMLADDLASFVRQKGGSLSEMSLPRSQVLHWTPRGRQLVRQAAEDVGFEGQFEFGASPRRSTDLSQPSCRSDLGSRRAERG